MADGSIQIKAFVKEDSSAFIRRGMVCNVDQTTECLKNIKLQLENSIKHRLSNVYVCIGGQSLHSMLNTVTRVFDVETKITQEIVNDLYEENRQIAVSDYWLTKIIPQDYYGGNQRLISSASVAGVVANKIKGNFLNIYYRHKFYELIKECLNSAGFKNVEYMMTPIVLGDSLLSMDAMRTRLCACGLWKRHNVCGNIFFKTSPSLGSDSSWSREYYERYCLCVQNRRK